MQFTTLALAGLSVLATTVSAVNPAAAAMTEAFGTATIVSADAGTGSTTTMTTTWYTTITLKHVVTSTKASTTVNALGASSSIIALPTGGIYPSTNTTTGIVSPVSPIASAEPSEFVGAANSLSGSHALAAALGLGAVVLAL